jgi:uncharacterized protein YjbI with pentapeptide repeats
MANKKHIAQLKKGVAAWNAWRKENPDIRPDLTRANLSKVNLSEANLSEANLGEANLEKANLEKANFRKANLKGANFKGIDLWWAYMREAKLFKAELSEEKLQIVDLSKDDLRRANLRGARLDGAYLRLADLSGADLSKATLLGVNFNRAKLIGANLEEANLRNAVLVDTDLTKAILNKSRVYGVSVWNVTTTDAKQQNLVITDPKESNITVDDLKLAQFIYLMLNNAEIRGVIDTITSKAVLILGRFTKKRKAVLDALREELRKRDYLPILFDFAVPAARDITETVSLLARMARFIIADLTDPSSVPKELEAIVPHVAVPVQPLLEGSSRPYAMFYEYYWKYEWLLPVYRYEGLEPLLATLAEKVIAPAEGKAKSLQERRRMIEAELTKPQ